MFIAAFSFLFESTFFTQLLIERNFFGRFFGYRLSEEEKYAMRALFPQYSTKYYPLG